MLLKIYFIMRIHRVKFIQYIIRKLDLLFTKVKNMMSQLKCMHLCQMIQPWIFRKPTIKYRKLWLKCFNEDGDPFWPKCPYIALGEHDVNQVIKLSIHVNKDGIKANMNDKNNTGKIITESSKKNKGYIFEKLIATEESTNKESTTKESSNKRIR